MNDVQCIVCGSKTFNLTYNHNKNEMVIHCSQCDNYIEIRAYAEDPLELGLPAYGELHIVKEEED